MFTNRIKDYLDPTDLPSDEEFRGANVFWPDEIPEIPEHAQDRAASYDERADFCSDLKKILGFEVGMRIGVTAEAAKELGSQLEGTLNGFAPLMRENGTYRIAGQIAVDGRNPAEPVYVDLDHLVKIKPR